MPNDKTIEEDAFGEEELPKIEGLPGAEEFPDEDEIEMEITATGADAGISPLDPDFILFALPFALFVDVIIDVPLEIIGHFLAEVPKIIGIIIDIIVFLILIFPGWMHWRLGKIEKSKRERRVALQRTVQKATQRLVKLQKIGNVSPKVFERYMRLYGQQMGKIGKAAAKAARKPLTRTLIKGGLLYWESSLL